MNLRSMRRSNWTGRLLAHAAHLNAFHRPARECGNMVRNGSIRAGDQEILGLACYKSIGSCASLPARFHQDKCEGMGGRAEAVIFHFNCRGSPERNCPTGACSRLAAEFTERYRPPTALQ